MNEKNYSFDLETFRDMLQICPNLPCQKFVDPPFEEEILAFIRELGYPGDINVTLYDVRLTISPNVELEFETCGFMNPISWNEAASPSYFLENKTVSNKKMKFGFVSFHLEFRFNVSTWTRFKAQSIGSSYTDVLDSQGLLVLSYRNGIKSRQHTSPSMSLFDVGSSWDFHLHVNLKYQLGCSGQDLKDNANRTLCLQLVNFVVLLNKCILTLCPNEIYNLISSWL
ncbi:hypothetical protein Tco_1033723 [Tanacetum coccineum]